MFRSFRTGEIIHPNMLRWTFPSNWRYSIISALDCLASLDVPYDDRMEEAISNLLGHADGYGRLPTLAPHPGKYFFRLESTKEKSRFNTLRLLRILKKYKKSLYLEIINRKMES